MVGIYDIIPESNQIPQRCAVLPSPFFTRVTRDVCCAEEYVAQSLCVSFYKGRIYLAVHVDTMSIKKYFEITVFPLTNVLRLNRNLLPLAISHGS